LLKSKAAALQVPGLRSIAQLDLGVGISGAMRLPPEARRGHQTAMAGQPGAAPGEARVKGASLRASTAALADHAAAKQMAATRTEPTGPPSLAEGAAGRGGLREVAEHAAQHGFVDEVDARDVGDNDRPSAGTDASAWERLRSRRKSASRQC
jgi:hypothetical protein